MTCLKSHSSKARMWPSPLGSRVHALSSKVILLLCPSKDPQRSLLFSCWNTHSCCLAAGVADYIFQSRKKGETPILFSSLTYVKKLAELWMDLNFIINLEYVCFSPANKKMHNKFSQHSPKQTNNNKKWFREPFSLKVNLNSTQRKLWD